MKGELDLSAIEDRLEDASEFFRMWTIKQGGQAFCIIDPQHLGADPALFGMAVVDALRHGAKAWSQAVQISEEAAFDRIMEGFNAEMASPTDTPRQVGTGKPN